MTKNHYLISLGSITLMAVILRFWGLGELQALIFDEVYFPKYGHGYITSTYYFDVHPPLSKYLIGIGIWLHNSMPWVTDPSYDTVSVEQLSAISWRWLNALTGTALVIVVARLSLVLHPSKVLSLLIAFFVATDGTFVVESRFGLNNIYLVFFGVCGMLFLAQALHAKENLRRSLILCGIFIGLSYSIKWNGLGYSLVAWTLCLVPCILFFANRFNKDPDLDIQSHPRAQAFHQIKFWEYGLYLFVLPFIVHFLLWQPHLMMFDQFGFIEMQKQILGFHSNSVKPDEHPYCSAWYGWPAQLRPMGYYFVAETSSSVRAEHTYTDIHLLGNPILFWLSALAVLALTFTWFLNLLRWFRGQKIAASLTFQSIVIIGFYGNWLPWSLVSRCLFQYLYMPASLFAFMALAWFIYQGLNAKQLWLRIIGSLLLLSVVLGFIFWLPVQLGIPMHPDSFYDRMWLKSWI